MKFIFLFLCAVVTPVQAADLDKIQSFIKVICKYPEAEGKSIKVSGSIKGDAGSKLKIIKLKGSGELSIEQEKWEGIQRVSRKNQLEDNKTYRECGQAVLPMLLSAK